MIYRYKPEGVCSRSMELELEGGIIKDVRIESGCDGNLKGIAALIQGRPAREVAAALRGIRCGGKETSCPDQLSRGIELALIQAEEEAGVE